MKNFARWNFRKIQGKIVSKAQSCHLPLQKSSYCPEEKQRNRAFDNAEKSRFSKTVICLILLTLSLHFWCRTFAPRLSLHFQCGAFAPRLSLHFQCGAFAPRLSLHFQCGAFAPRLSLHFQCGAFAPRLSEHILLDKFKSSIEWKFQGGGGWGSKVKNHPWKWSGYLEPHIIHL